MPVVLLAAGLGSRLGSLTERLPKALIAVAGEPLLAYAVRFAQAVQGAGRGGGGGSGDGDIGGDIIVVAGFGYELVAAEVATRRLPVTLVRNPDFKDGNLVSLFASRAHLGGAGFLLMNVDHIYRPAIAAVVAPAADDVTAFVDQDRTLGDDDMKVALDGQGRVRRISKTLTSFDRGYVGMTKVPAAAAARYWAAADRALGEEGRAIHVERVLARLAESGRPPLTRDISGHGWLEVDLPEERERAELALRAGTW
ncbi:MAG TPA: NTP transferase domain-containing protein [Polyangia bacterium]|jgi:choline kinase|nr:NTP transferase domain-containing protein [Polyangia bacterium]